MEEQTQEPVVQVKAELRASHSLTVEKKDISRQQREYVDDLFQNHRYVWSLLLFGDESGALES